MTTPQDLNRRIINTGNIIMAQKAHLVPGLFSKYPGDYTDVDSFNSLRIEPSHRMPTETALNTYKIAKCYYGEDSYGSEPFGSSNMQIPSNIAIQDITVGGISCNGECTMVCPTSCPTIVDIIVTWTNSGGTSGTFTPWITIAGGDSIYGTTTTVLPGIPNTTTFQGISLTQGAKQVCFYTGTVT